MDAQKYYGRVSQKFGFKTISDDFYEEDPACRDGAGRII